MTDHAAVALPIQRSCPFSPPAEYEELREREPISRVDLPDGYSAWALTRHEDIRAMLTDPRFSSDRTNPNFPAVSAGQRQLARTGFPLSMISMDGKEHAAARREVVGEFTVRRMRALQPRIQEIVDERIDAMLAGPKPADLVKELSLPVPSLVICEQLGVPYKDHDFFQERSSKLLSRTVPVDERQRARDELRDYLDALITEKEAAPGDDLLGRQILKHREAADGGRLHSSEEIHQDLVSLSFLLLIAGHETTANMISLGTLALINNPKDAEALRNDPSKTPDAIEELLRVFSIVEFATSRVATEDVELGGVTIKAGEGVVALGNSANHDPEAFPDPYDLDIERGARNHVSFGFGAHQCLGQNLARMELQIVFDTLVRRIPDLKLAVPQDELPFKDDSNIYGLYEMPVTW